MNKRRYIHTLERLPVGAEEMESENENTKK